MSIKAWAILCALIVFVVMIAIQIFVNLKYTESMNESYTEKTIDLLTRSMSSIRFPMVTRDTEEIAKIVDAIVDIEDVFAIEVSIGNEIVYRKEDESLNLSYGVPIIKKSIEILDESTGYTNEFGDSVDGKQSSENLGQVMIYISTSGTQKYIEGMYNRSIIVVFSVLFVLSIVVYLVNRFRKGVARILHAMNKVKESNFSKIEEFPTSGILELNELSMGAGDLSLALRNKMIELEESFNHIRESRDMALKREEFTNDLLQKISHELRTPAHSISNMHTLVLKKLDSGDDKNLKEVKAMFEVCYKASTQLDLVLNEVLNTSKLSAQLPKVKTTQFDASEFFSDLFSVNTSRFEEKGLFFRIRESKSSALIRKNFFVSSDKPKLKGIMDNLITNAFKFTESGSVKIEWGIVKKDEGYDFQVSVKDTGVGISPENVGRVFDQYYQCEKVVTKKNEGMGLGLSYVKNYLDALKGNAHVESTLGAGSIFTVSFPVQIVSEIHPNTLSKEDLSVPFLRVLVVDDNANTCSTMTAILKDLEVSAVIERNPLKALSIANQKEFDIMFIDYHMPGTDGIQLANHIKNGLNENSRLICMTADAHRETEALVAKSDFDELLIKPISIDRIVTIINQSSV